MSPWQAGDVAIAVRDATCGCGKHHVRQRGTYRVEEVAVHPLLDHVYLRVATVEHFFRSEYFRREQPSTEDVFKLAAKPVPVPEPA